MKIRGLACPYHGMFIYIICHKSWGLLLRNKEWTNVILNSTVQISITDKKWKKENGHTKYILWDFFLYEVQELKKRIYCDRCAGYLLRWGIRETFEMSCILIWLVVTWVHIYKKQLLELHFIILRWNIFQKISIIKMGANRYKSAYITCGNQ